MDFYFGDEEDYFNFKNRRNHSSSISDSSSSDNTRPLSGMSSSSTSSSSSSSLSSASSPLSSTSYTGPIYFEPVPCSPSCYSCSSASSSRLQLEDLLGLGDDCDGGDERGNGEEEEEEEDGDEREEERDEWDNEVGDVVCDLGVDQGGFGWPRKGEIIEFEFDFDFDFDFESRRRTGSDRERDRDKEDYDGPHDWQSFNGDDDENNDLFDPYNELSGHPPSSSSLPTGPAKRM
ncbi:hypothetical protein PNOK_0007100 [Pyrrhoderma noxium]|uniref:Uncharacterized protein n=1 Tax=Pyrrhoderma noxium TaxID=2282107 RepID=A0A286UTX2_9AGAM|nr:hypothetical protein PNOK_0007100 [Pyrrhoderma noxium]